MKNKLKSIKPLNILLWVVIAALIYIIPHTYKGYTLKVIDLSMLYGIMVLSTVITLGFGGQMSMASVAFFGLGAYTVGNLCTNRMGLENFPPVVALLIAVVLCGIISYLLGLLLERLDGTFFTFATIGVVQVCAAFFSQYRPLFGGPDGINGVAKFVIFGMTIKNPTSWFYVLCVFLIGTGLFTYRLKRTKFGRSLFAIRDNKTAAVTLGVNVYKTRVYGFMLQGIICGMCGALYAFFNSYIGSSMFTFAKATDMMMMVMIGGLNSIPGSICGAFIVTILPETLRSLQSYLRLIFGIIVLLLMIFMPSGLAGLVSNTRQKIAKRFREKKGEVK